MKLQVEKVFANGTTGTGMIANPSQHQVFQKRVAVMFRNLKKGEKMIVTIGKDRRVYTKRF